MAQITLKELLAQRAAQKAQPIKDSQAPQAAPPVCGNTHIYTNSLQQTLNEKQSLAVDLAKKKQSFCLIGAAGTGKTTSVFTICEQLIQNNLLHTHPNFAQSKHLRGKQSVAFVAFTNRAVKRLTKSLPQSLRDNALTIHMAIEYQPEYVSSLDEYGMPCTKRMFMPKLNAMNQDPHLQLVIIEESSMVSVELHQQLVEAFPNATIIYLGDLNQLPPVYGASILGYKLTHLPICELTEIYRQAAGSQIIQLAYSILESSPLHMDLFDGFKQEDNQNGKVILHKFQKKVEAEFAALNFAKFICNRIANKQINLDESQILIPFNKGFGTELVNKLIADHIAKEQGLCTYEVKAAFLTSYWAIGDKVLFNKELWKISDIKHNLMYVGDPTRESVDLDRFGNMRTDEDESLNDLGDLTIDSSVNLSDFKLIEDSNDMKKRAASHVIHLVNMDSGEEIEIQNAGDVNEMELAYAMTVHKSQGCEWDHVIFVAHHSHANMLSRELVYTAVTRAAKKLEIVCDWDAFAKAPTKRRIKGDTLEEKIKYFVGNVQREKAAGICPITNVRLSEDE